MNDLDVDTRSDVYSLGVLLYELLTGSTPFDSQALKDAGYDEMRRIIREDEPPKPSARISTLAAEALSTVSGKRSHDPRRLSDSLRGELDWIVLRAMEKDRTRRYESASDLAADIERYLNDEPVQACPPSWVYRTRKLVRRHKVALTTTAVVAAALLIGTGVSAWQAVEANRSRQIADESAERETAAREEADTQRERADAQREAAERQKKQAEKNLQTAIDAMDDMYRLATQWLASDTAATAIQRQFLMRAEQFYGRIVADPETYRLSADRLAEIHKRIGLLNLKTRKYRQAATSFSAAIAIQEKLLKTDPDDLDVRTRLASNLNAAGVTHGRLGQHNKAQSSYRASARHYRRLLDQQPAEAKHRDGIARSQQNLAGLFMDQNRLAEAEQLVRAARRHYSAVARRLPTLDEDVNHLKASGLLAGLLRRQQKYAEATKVATAALGRCENLLMFDGDSRGGREVQVNLHGELAEILIAQEKYAPAEPHLRRQLHVLVNLMAARRDPFTFVGDLFERKDPDLAGKKEPRRWGEWAKIKLQLARVLRKTGQQRQAELTLGPALSITIYLSRGYPDVLKYRVGEANARAEAALLLADRWPAESRGYLLEAARAWRKAAQDFEGAADYRRGLWGEQADAAWFVATFHEFDFTDPARQQAIDTAIGELPRKTDVLVRRAQALYYSGYQNWKSSVESFQLVVKWRDGGDAFDRFHLAIGLAKTGEPEEARQWFNRGVEWMEQNKGREDEELVRLQGEAEQAIGH
ncbi:MAG: hypothetical protein IIA67_14105 [Planctomycetes bacterium]|nr:hypothetical protein [Planctomycetota bacterium]